MIAAVLPSVAQATDKVTWLDITAGLMIPVIVAAFTAGIALYLHYRQQRSQQRDRLRETFSEALRAVADYQELPYMIRRRSDSPPMTREELTLHASEVQSRLDFYVARFDLESTELGDAYRRLVTTTRHEAGLHMTSAWHEERVESDAAVPLGASYDRTAAGAEWRQCLAVMRSYLGQRGGGLGVGNGSRSSVARLDASLPRS